MSALDNVTAHWESVSGLRAMDVPEWGMTIHFRPPNVREAVQIERELQRGGNVSAALMTLVVLARDADGKRLFSDADRAELERKADASVIMRLAAEMFPSDDLTAEDAKKN